MAREDIAGRIREVREKTGLSQKALAAKIGVAYRTWQDIENGKNVPSGETLLKISDLGFNPGWVLTGTGGMQLGAAVQATTIDARLMERLARLAMAAHIDAGIKLAPDRVAAEATILYNDLAAQISDLTDTEGIETALPLLRYQLKKRLAEAAAAPGTGKREAS